jgi:seryl-tRNA synthetase
MLDINVIRNNLEALRAGAVKKHVEVDLDRLVDLDDERRRLIRLVEDAVADQRRRSKALGKLSDEERQNEVASLGELKEVIKRNEESLASVMVDFDALMLRVPNFPAEEVPEGKSDADNVELYKVGEIPISEFDRQDHVELGANLGILDIERGVKLSGARFYVLKGAGALLHRAVLEFAYQHMIKKGFLPMEVPLLVRDPAMVGTAYYPGGEDQAYRMERDQLSLVGTAEVPVTAYRGGEILDEAELPIRMVARSPCFRREAGAAGKDTRGLYRIHQFEKVEQVVLMKNDEQASIEEHQSILRNSEEVLQALELPYRVVNVCGGDLGVPHVQKFDIETWMPSRGDYGETHSASRFHDFQSRRLNIRYRDESKKKRFCHTLNNTVVASPRILIPLLELYQQKDGSVVVPDALRPFMMGIEVIKPA